jgi:hypothetical protein
VAPLVVNVMSLCESDDCPGAFISLVCLLSKITDKQTKKQTNKQTKEMEALGHVGKSDHVGFIVYVFSKQLVD